jgi:hypothetical protein
LYRDREICTTMGDVGGFSLSDPCFLHRGNHVVDFYGESVRRELVGRTFSSAPIESWVSGCAGLPSSGVMVLDVGAHS